MDQVNYDETKPEKKEPSPPCNLSKDQTDYRRDREAQVEKTMQNVPQIEMMNAQYSEYAAQNDGITKTFRARGNLAMALP